MSETDRRTVLGMAMLAVLAPAVLPQRASAAIPGLIAPPAAPMQYRRTLERQLAGGAAIVVSRVFRVGFTHVANGFRVDGRQASVEARFPPGLEQFAALEEAQEPTGLFPLVLDPFGQIASRPQDSAEGQSLRAAVNEVMARIDRQPLAEDERRDLLRFVETFHQAGSAIVASLPTDLFAPMESERSDRQTVALPTGEEGLVVSRFVALRDPATGLMREAMREIRTEIDGDRRQTRESWSLTPA